MSTKNIIIFGQTGAGKSSVVNLMTGTQTAKTSIGIQRCTLHWEEYSIGLDGHSLRVFDTIGLEEPQLGITEYLNIVQNSYNLITKLRQEGGIDLLLFCVRAGRFSSTTPSNYQIFYEHLCEKKVPIILVLTGLEREPKMDDWWTKSKHVFDKHGVFVDDHACITAINGAEWRNNYEESQRLVRDLVLKHCFPNGRRGFNGGGGWFGRFMNKLKVFLKNSKTPNKKDVVKVLTQRCGVPREVAVEMAEEIKAKTGLLNIFIP